MTVNDTRDFGVGRLLTNTNWQALLAIGYQVNERLLDAQLEACACAPDAWPPLGRCGAASQSTPSPFAMARPSAAACSAMFFNTWSPRTAPTGSPVSVQSVELRVTETVAPGQLFTPFHYFEANANQVTQSAFDPVSREPNYKQSAVRIELATREPGLPGRRSASREAGGIRDSGFAAAARNRLSIARFWRGSTIPLLPRGPEGGAR